ncbi:MAG: TolC family outer membrane protein [Rhodospirillaceae bacterium]|nr:TolC family outer membrane protein [Rhodospirillaceae bacterium]
MDMQRNTQRKSPVFRRRLRPTGRKALPGSAGTAAAAVAALLALGAGASETRAETLAQALARAYQHNPQLLAARSALRAVDEQAAQAYSNWRPGVSFSADAGLTASRSKQPGSNFQSGKFRSTDRVPAGASLNVTQNLYRGGRNEHQLRQANYNISAQRARLAGVEQTVLLGAVRAYMNVVRDLAVVRLNRNNEQVLARQLQATRDRFSVGEVTRTDVSQAQARLAQARAATIQSQGVLQASRANYANVVGVVPGAVEAPRPPTGLSGDPSKIAQQAQRDNPAVVAARWDERSARAAVDLVRGELMPTLSINGQLQRRYNAQTPDTIGDSASITANIAIPLYRSGAVASRVRAAKQIVLRRRDDLRQAQRAAAENAARANAILRTARSSVTAFEAQLEASRIALNGVRQEAAAGLRTVLDTLDAQQELLNAQVNLVRARRDLVVATYELLAAVGRMNAKNLKLKVTVYDPKAHYRKVRRKAFGFGEPIGEGPASAQ